MKRLTAICVAAVCCLGMMLNGEAKAKVTSFEITVCEVGMKLAYNKTSLKEVLQVVGRTGLTSKDALLLVHCYDSVMQPMLKGVK